MPTNNFKTDNRPLSRHLRTIYFLSYKKTIGKFNLRNDYESNKTHQHLTWRFAIGFKQRTHFVKRLNKDSRFQDFKFYFVLFKHGVDTKSFDKYFKNNLIGVLFSQPNVISISFIIGSIWYVSFLHFITAAFSVLHPIG